jgi:lipopolysaccharide export system protein LptA
MQGKEDGAVSALTRIMLRENTASVDNVHRKQRGDTYRYFLRERHLNLDGDAVVNGWDRIDNFHVRSEH